MNNRASILTRGLLGLTLILCAFIPTIGHAEAELNPVNEEQWFRYYYQNPRPENLPPWLAKMVEDGAARNKARFYPVFAFSSQIIAQNPSLVDEIVRLSVGYSEENRAYIGLLLWHGKAGNAREIMAKDLALNEKTITDITSSQPYSAVEHPVTTPSDMDMLWSTFMATGNEAAVNRIIDYLLTPSSDKAASEKSKEEFITDVYLSAAKWSLESNARQDKKVAEIIKSRYNSADGLLKTRLAPIVAAINAR